jgi:cold-inducible RNA-binding protein
VFVGNLSFDVTREELIEAFSAAGKVVDAKVPTDRETGRPRGFAFVEFEDDDAAQKSIALMNGKDLKGRPLRVNEAENRPPRPGGAGGGYRPAFGAGNSYRPGGPPSFGAPPTFGDFPTDDRGRPFRSKGSRRNIRRRKRGFD